MNCEKREKKSRKESVGSNIYCEIDDEENTIGRRFSNCEKNYARKNVYVYNNLANNVLVLL